MNAPCLHTTFRIQRGKKTRPSLNRRIPDLETMKREITAWEQERNEQKATVNWRFTNQNARVKLERLYPKLTLS